MSTNMGMIDQTARIESGAVIGKDVSIGPYCVVGPNVTIEDGCKLVAHVYVTGHTTLGAETTIYPFASLGTPPQSVKYKGGPTRLVIGPKCEIREHVTMNTGTEEAGGLTRVGARCLFMVATHVAHDCHLGDDVTMANNATLAGHVTVGDNVFFGGVCAIHQFSRIGENAMIGGVSGVRGDVIPFGFVSGQHAELVGINVVGMKRRGFKRDDMHRLRRALGEIFGDKGNFKERLEAAVRTYGNDPVVGRVVAFIHEGGSRALVQPPRSGNSNAETDAA